MDQKRLLDIVSNYGTPIYIYDFNKMVAQIKKLREAFQQKVNIYYSVKANPNLTILKYIKEYVDGVEVASKGELVAAQKAGIQNEKILFIGPGKSYDELRYAVQQQIKMIIIESQAEMGIVNELAQLNGKKTSVAIRVNPKLNIHNSKLKMGGDSQQFGIDEEQVESILESNQYPHLKVEGLHFYFGTQCLDSISLEKTYAKIFELYNYFKDKIDIQFLDLGGGFGIPYFKGETELDIAYVGNTLVSLLEKNKVSGVHIAIESGRFITAESGVFLTKTLYVKESRGKKFAITDGGSNNHTSTACIGRFIRNNFPATVLNDSIETEMVTIVGPLCTPTDILVQDVELPKIKEGDIVAVLNSGAYGYSYSQQMFLSHETPAEVLIKDSNTYLIRKKGSVEDFFLNQIII